MMKRQQEERRSRLSVPAPLFRDECPLFYPFLFSECIGLCPVRLGTLPATQDTIKVAGRETPQKGGVIPAKNSGRDSLPESRT